MNGLPMKRKAGGERRRAMSVTRREFMVGAGALAAHTRVTGFPALAQRRPLRVGVFISEVDAQGVDEQVEPYVTQMRTGRGLAASEINDRGGVLGRPLELMYQDDGGTPPTGTPAEGRAVMPRHWPPTRRRWWSCPFWSRTTSSTWPAP